MKNLVLYDVERYCYPPPLDSNPKLNIISVIEDHYFITEEKKCSIFTKVSVDGSITKLKIGKKKRFLDTITHFVDEQYFLLVNTSEVVFIKNMKRKVKYHFEEEVLAANVCASAYCIAAMTKKRLSVYSIELKLEEPTILLMYSTPLTTEVEVSNNKAASDSKHSKEPIGTDSKYICHDKKPFISWNNNGYSFAINVYDGGKRVVKFYDYKCEILNEFNFDGLEPLISYGPTDNLVMVITSQSGCDQVLTVINQAGEVCRQTEIFDRLKVVDFKWSLCGNAVAVVHDNLIDLMYLDIYVESNSTWICKQRLQFCKENWCTFDWVFAPNNFYKITVNTVPGIYTYTFTHKLVKCTKPNEHYCLIATTSGRCATFNYLMNGVDGCEKLPSTYSVTMNNIVSYIAFDILNYSVGVVDCDYHIKLFNYEDPTNWFLLLEFDLVNLKTLPLCYRTIAVRKKITVLALYYSADPNMPEQLFFYDRKSNGALNLNRRIISHGVFSILYPINTNYDRISIACFRHADETFLVIDSYAFQVDGELMKFNLSICGILSINGLHVKAYVTSMYCNKKYLVLTVRRDANLNNENPTVDYLISVHITAENIRWLINHDDPFSTECNTTIERGALLLNHIRNSAAMLMLLPSGKTQTATMDKIAVDILAEFINHLKYDTAYGFIKFHNMDLTLLVDLDPLAFIRNPDKVYGQLLRYGILPKIAITLEDSVTEYVQGEYVYDLPFIHNKRERVFEALISSYTACDDIEMNAEVIVLLSLHSSYPVLNLDRAIRFLSSYASKTPKAENVEVAIKSLAEYVTDLEIFKSALSIYDLDLAERVAALQVDPTIYSSFVTRLRSNTGYRRKFTIADYLKNHKLATVYSAKLYDSKENIKTKFSFFRYVKRYRTFRTAYQCIDIKNEFADRIAILFAKDLDLAFNYADAGMVLFRYEHYIEASEIFLKGLHFHEALAAINLSALKKKDKKLKLKQITGEMALVEQFKEDVPIYLSTFKDIDKQLAYVLRNQAYMVLFNLLQKYDNSIVDIHLKPNILAYIDKIIIRLAEDKLKFEKLFGRLVELRDKRTTRNDLSLDQLRIPADFQLEVALRKRRSVGTIGVGGKFEDIVIMAQLHDMIAEIFCLQDKMKELYYSLLIIFPTVTKHAERLHSTFINFEKQLIESALIIWPTCFTNLYEYERTLRICPNLELLAPLYRFAPVVRIEWESMLAEEHLYDPPL